jgi:hypothetical protein
MLIVNMPPHCWKVGTALALVILLSGCSNRDMNSDRNVTIFKLRVLGEITTALVQDGVNLRQIHSVQELLAAAHASKRVTEYDYIQKYYETDYWRRAFRWAISTNQEGETVVQITSDGKNGIPEDGKGDDLYIEILFKSNGDSEMRLNKER